MNTDITGECRFDAGGYFIINGSEKTIIPQERAAENKIYCFDIKKNNNKWSWLAEIKSIDDETTTKIIQKLANDIGLTLPQNIINYLLTRIPRDFISIQNAISTINQESYTQKKKVTLPLVKNALIKYLG